MNDGNFNPEDQEVDIKEIVNKLWDSRKRIIKACAIAIAVGLVVAFSIPKEYTSHASLAPEFASKNTLSNLGSYASMMGFNLPSNIQTRDAVYPDLYPDIIYSTPFITSMFNLPVTFVYRKDKVETSLYDYLMNYTRKPWWSVITSAPFKFVAWAKNLVSGREEDTVEEDMSNVVVDDFKLTIKQERIYKKLASRISVNVDKKTYVVSIAATMQDPTIAALVAETTLNNLQSYITNYRTEKSRVDLEYSQSLFDEAKKEYERARSAYARYMDSHQGAVSMRSRIEEDKLRNESDFAYQLFNQTAQKLQMAQAKVQEETPVFKTLQPPTVPLRKSKPSKVKILFVMVFLAFCGTSGWILWGEDIKGFFRSRQ